MSQVRHGLTMRVNRPNKTIPHVPPSFSSAIYGTKLRRYNRWTGGQGLAHSSLWRKRWTLCSGLSNYKYRVAALHSSRLWLTTTHTTKTSNACLAGYIYFKIRHIYTYTVSTAACYICTVSLQQSRLTSIGSATLQNITPTVVIYRS